VPTFYVQGEFLRVWTRANHLEVPLLTTGTGPNAGGLADPGTIVIWGRGSEAAWDGFNGGRLDVGVPLGAHLTLETRGFWLAEQALHLAAGSDANGAPVLARPYVGLASGNLNALRLIASPGLLAGGVQLTGQSQWWGLETNVVGVGGEGGFRWEWLAGLRFVEMQEDLTICDSSTVLAPGAASFAGNPLGIGDLLNTSDRFQTRNYFYGPQFGLRGETRLGRLGLSATAKVALGNTRQVVNLDGLTAAATAAGTFSTMPSGVLAVPGTTGRYTQDGFTVLPEVGLRVAYEVSGNLRLSLGYDFLYWSRVARPGGSGTPVINDSLVPSSPNFNLPTNQIAPFNPSIKSDTWMYGLNCGLEWRF
jgi:hypothetical protein